VDSDYNIDARWQYVIKAMQSLNSRGYVKTQFSWQYCTTPDLLPPYL
jgi:hypothetical protein